GRRDRALDDEGALRQQREAAVERELRAVAAPAVAVDLDAARAEGDAGDEQVEPHGLGLDEDAAPAFGRLRARDAGVLAGPGVGVDSGVASGVDTGVLLGRPRVVNARDLGAAGRARGEQREGQRTTEARVVEGLGHEGALSEMSAKFTAA